MVIAIVPSVSAAQGHDGFAKQSSPLALLPIRGLRDVVRRLR